MADSPSQRLCTSCGLCCDGTIYDVVKLDPAEVPAISARDVDVINIHGKHAMAQACPMLSGTLCSIYPDRPGSCRKFECGVLHRFGRGALSFDEALDLTKTARLLADTARKAQPMDSPAEARRTWLAQHRAGDLGPQSRAPGDAAAHLAMLALNLFLDKHFRKPHQRVTVSHAVRRSTP